MSRDANISHPISPQTEVDASQIKPGLMLSGGGVARCRLAEERKAWRKSHPYGFVAKLEMLIDGSINLMVWECIVPGRKGTEWEGGYYPLTMYFNEDYPIKPPMCMFPTGFFHVNVYDTGKACLSILGEAWKPSMTVPQILVSVQDMLHNPNPTSPAQLFICRLFTKNITEYKNRVRQQAKLYPLSAVL